MNLWKLFRKVCKREESLKMSPKSSAVQRIGGAKVMMMKLCNESVVITYLVLVSSILGLAGAAGGLQSEDSAPPSKVQKCREGCLDKVRSIQWWRFCYREDKKKVFSVGGLERS